MSSIAFAIALHSILVAALVLFTYWLTLPLIPREQAILRANLGIALVYLIPPGITMSFLWVPHQTSTALQLPIWHFPLLEIWALGTGAMLANTALDWKKAQQVRDEVRPLNDAALEARFANLLSRAKLKERVTIGQSDRLLVPAVIGFCRATVLFPPAALVQLSHDELEAVLAHELAHVLRHDAIHVFVEAVLKALLFFNPLVWILLRLVAIEREAACDRLAIGMISQPKPLASGLLKLSISKSVNPIILTAFSSEYSGPLRDRVDRILRRNAESASPSNSKGLLAALVVVSMLVGNMLPLEPRSQANETEYANLISLKDEVCDILKRDNIYWNPVYDEGGEATVVMQSGNYYMNGAQLPPATSASLATVFSRYRLSTHETAQLTYFGSRVKLITG